MSAQKVTLDTAEKFTWGKAGTAWFLAKNAPVSVVEKTIGSGTKEIRHLHQKSWQYFHVLSGTADIEIDGVELTLNANEGVEVKAGLGHQMKNEQDVDLTFIMVSVPNSTDDRVVLE
jgi:mannose-6-phosphate isomerase-like protein (cupin superfamily)